MRSLTTILTSFLFDGFLFGSVIGVVHVIILASGGMYVLSDPMNVVASLLRWVAIAALCGATLGLLTALVFAGARTTDGRLPTPVPVVLVMVYVAPWLAFLAKDAMGKRNAMIVAAAYVVLAGIAVIAFAARTRRRPLRIRPRSNRVLVVVAILAILGYEVPRLLFRSDTPELESVSPSGDEFAAVQRFAAASAAFENGRWNVLLLTVDTLRADHLGLYGYGRPTTPVLDALAASGVVFENTFCQRPKTSPSFATILTGTYPARHGIHDAMQLLTPANTTLAEYLADVGYTTGAVITNGNLYPAFGFDQGFESYEYGHKDADAGADLAITWLEQRDDASPWFLWVHFTDPHTPYSPPAEYAAMFDRGEQSDLQHNIDLYDAEIRFTDAQLGRILDAVDRNGMRGRTLVVFTADHGESLGEHDYYYNHGLHPYEPSARIPLIVSAPGTIAVASRNSALAGGVDILPTVLDMAGIDMPEVVQGRSLVAATLGLDAGERDFVFIEAGYGLHDSYGITQATRRANSKYVHRLTRWALMPRDPASMLWSMNARIENGLAPDELYDLGSDPGETVNLILADPERSRAQREVLAAFARQIYAAGPLDADGATPGLDRETVKSLRNLGYIK